LRELLQILSQEEEGLRWLVPEAPFVVEKEKHEERLLVPQDSKEESEQEERLRFLHHCKRSPLRRQIGQSTPCTPAPQQRLLGRLSPQARTVFVLWHWDVLSERLEG
jgi:hypothetical protein